MSLLGRKSQNPSLHPSNQKPRIIPAPPDIAMSDIHELVAMSRPPHRTRDNVGHLPRTRAPDIDKSGPDLSSTRLGDVATSFAETARSYDEFVEATNFSFTSASDIAKMHTFSSALRKQLKKMGGILKLHSSAAKVATRIEVTSPNAETILSTDGPPVDASGAAALDAAVEDVTLKLREKVRAWQQEKRAELFQELLDAYGEWFHPIRPRHEGWVGGAQRQSMMIEEVYRVRVVDPSGQRERGDILEGNLNIQWNEEKSSARAGAQVYYQCVRCGCGLWEVEWKCRDKNTTITKFPSHYGEVTEQLHTWGTRKGFFIF